MNIFIYELKQYRKSIIIWSISFILITVMFIQFLPVFIEESEPMLNFFEGLSDAYISAMGINIESFFSEIGFYSYLFTYLCLMAAIQAMNIGLGIISKENRMKTADFLMAKPKNRSSIFIAKFISGICALLITQIFFYISSYLAMSIIGSENHNNITFVLISLIFSFIQILFFCLGIFLATIISKIKSVVPFTMGIVFSFYLLNIISGITGNENLAYFTPFMYFDTSYIIQNNSYETKFLSLSIILPIILTISSFIVYIKKDVPSV